MLPHFNQKAVKKPLGRLVPSKMFITGIAIISLFIVLYYKHENAFDSNVSPNVDNTIFFSTCSDGYVQYSATALLSIRKHQPKAKLMILSKYLSESKKSLLKQLNIEYLEVNLSSCFSQRWDYPIECYYLFAGPQVFYKRGYTFSMYVDGDVLCISEPFSVLSKLKVINFAGLVVGKLLNIFPQEDIPVLKEVFNLSDAALEKDRFHSGIVLFNNEFMARSDLLSMACTSFEISLKNGIPRKGDDSLFALIQLRFMMQDRLRFNPYAVVLTSPQSFQSSRITNNTLFLHFTPQKPWRAQQDELLSWNCFAYQYNVILKEYFK